MWEDGGEVARDEIVIFEVMAQELDRGWWRDCRRRPEEMFAQDAIVVRARKVELL